MVDLSGTPSYSDIRQIILDLKKQFGKIKNFAKHFKDGPFVRSSVLKSMLWEWDPTKLNYTEFIDYSKWLTMYSNSQDKFSLQIGENIVEERKYPYERTIDLVKYPKAKFPVTPPIKYYKMDNQLETKTNRNLNAFRKDKPKTTDGRVARLSNFIKKGSLEYHCELEIASYFQQVRTNLTIDYPIMVDTGSTTLRFIDSINGQLKPLSQSQLLNSIGVSAVVGFRRNHEWWIFNKLRKPDDGVAEKMLGSTSGVAELVPNQHVTDLLQYGEAEMIREFYNETGLNCKDFLRIVPLAFCRELVRGGKPQFLFFIEIKPIESNKFNQLFKKSVEGLDEFYNSWWTSTTANVRALSYEFAYNLILTLKFLQIEEKQSDKTIKL